MSAVIFNLHDVVLLITIYQCILFACFILPFKKGKKLSNKLLACFLLCWAAIPLDILINFGEAFRQFALDFSPNVFFIFGCAYWLESVFLLLFVRSLIYKDYRLKRSDLLFFLPFLLYLVYEMDNWFLLSYQEKMNFLTGYHLEDEPTYKFAVNIFRELFRAFCGALCIIELLKYQNRIKDEYASIETIDLKWLKLLIVGFLLVYVQAVFVVVAILFSVELHVLIDFEAMGLTANYFTMFLISLLIFFSTSYSPIFQGVTKSSSKEQEKLPFDPQDIQKLETYMAEQKPFLHHLLTLESLAKQVNISPRLLSQIINRHFEQNFFEFINGYRIEESQQLLQNTDNHKLTMLDIMDMSGFNSKATFNTFFKKIVGATPTQYRKRFIKYE
ncbi:helix-turn-helix domain-containing protein [Thalassotalea agarivorans]|uniref:Transcriptional regulator, AraC family n=1 Tax=Thalassotalea agarivorans TaxID=349064 RepID=A0A1H9YB63_THASX|nr:AraC family transcriptional regulator [Thalassotalea agarivorans]SES66047.1 transcriptional regulator, AraC family [Thalassotalea agarivorans]